MALTTLSTFKEAIDAQTTANDTYFTNLIDRATSIIEQQVVGRVLTEATYTEYIDGTGLRHMPLRNGPVESVGSVVLVTYDSNGNIDNNDTVSAGDYFVRGLRSENWLLPGYLQTNSGWAWTVGEQNYQVNYTAGFTSGSIPGDLEEACIRLTAALRNQRKDAGLASRDLGSGGMTFLRFDEVLAEVKATLSAYRSMRY